MVYKEKVKMMDSMSGIICRECGGIGCNVCKGSGYSKAYYLEHNWEPSSQLNDTVPIPYGKILPNLTDCYYVNEGIDEDSYLEPSLCPNCGSDNVVGLSEKYNPNCSVNGDNLTPSGRWFCISCQDSWCYEREH